MENSLFPISMKVHIVFALIALLIFGLQFIRTRKKYYVILAVAVPCSLLAYVIPDLTFFYILGVSEAVALLAALIMSKTIDRDPPEPEEEAETAEAASPEDSSKESAEVPAEEEAVVTEEAE